MECQKSLTAEPRVTKAEIRECGEDPELLRQRGYEGFAIVTSPLAHYSIRKAASLLGIGERDVLVAEQDAAQRADSADIEAKLELVASGGCW